MEISLAAEKIAQLGPIPITNSMITSWVASIILIVFAIFGTRKLTLRPSKFQNGIELVVEMLLNLANSIFADMKQTKKYFPFLATIFLFIITNNWLGLLPGIGSIGIHEGSKFIPIFRGGNADLNSTLALAILTMVLVQIFGILAIGFFKYAGKFINFKQGPIGFFVGILEIIGEFSRIISFSFRLFGNVFAGEVLLAVITWLLPYVGPIPFYGLEIFVGFVQALVFTMLAGVFIKTAISDHNSEEHEEHAAAH
ncbi:MAG: F0F1 ATP synthase subunit A [Candidatus Berkelbacteria bacterium]|nr:F0F1 ATP synthase subunit A [Candidatus Berkelbacteria bacterium]